MYVRYILAILIFTAFGNMVEAKVSLNTTYSYFKVQGKTSREIYISLLKHAKGPGGHDAYATITTRIYQKSNFLVGKNCAIKDYSN